MFEAVLELKHCFPLLVVVDLEFSMFRIHTGAEACFSNVCACGNSTDSIKMFVKLTELFLDMG